MPRLVNPALRRAITPLAFVNLELLALIIALAEAVNLNPGAVLKLRQKVTRKVEEGVKLPATLLMATL